MTVDFYATEPQYIDHLAPVWHALPARARGTFLVRHGLTARARAAGIINPKAAGLRPELWDRPVVVASYKDEKRAGQGVRPVVYLEHGAGQTYRPRPPIEPRRNVILALLPRLADLADHYAAEMPEAALAGVGCPKLDPWAQRPPAAARAPVVAFGWHWRDGRQPETMTAWDEYAPALRAIAQTHRVIGHAHPRIWHELGPAYRRLGIETVPDFAEVLRRASLYVADNTSTLFEFAATGRPVVVLNASWYRRRHRHGLRFWDVAHVGLQVDHRAELADTIGEALSDPPAAAKNRADAVARVYAHHDGKAASRAAEAIMTLLTSTEAKGEAKPCAVCGKVGCGRKATAHRPVDELTTEDPMAPKTKSPTVRARVVINGTETILKVTQADAEANGWPILGDSRGRPLEVQTKPRTPTATKPRTTAKKTAAKKTAKK